ncbi:MAG: PIN domain-containing protein [Thermoplasmata archaeon]
MPPPLVLLDANALMMPFQFALDLEDELVRLLGEYRAAVPTSVVRELEDLAPSNSTAKAALQLASRFPVMAVEGEGDDALLALARAEGAAVLTNDRALRRRLREADLPVIYLRERSRLEAVGLPPG